MQILLLFTISILITLSSIDQEWLLNLDFFFFLEIIKIIEGIGKKIIHMCHVHRDIP